MALRLLVATCVIALARGAMAQSQDQIAVIGCQNVAGRQLRTQRSDVDAIRFSPNPLVRRRSSRTFIVEGSGRYQTSSGGSREFTFECTYGIQSAKTSVTIRSDSTAGSR